MKSKDEQIYWSSIDCYTDYTAKAPSKVTGEIQSLFLVGHSLSNCIENEINK